MKCSHSTKWRELKLFAAKHVRIVKKTKKIGQSCGRKLDDKNTLKNSGPQQTSWGHWDSACQGKGDTRDASREEWMNEWILRRIKTETLSDLTIITKKIHFKTDFIWPKIMEEWREVGCYKRGVSWIQ